MAAQAILIDEANYLSLQRQRNLNSQGEVTNSFYIFSHAGCRKHDCLVAHSERSWEHALAIAKSGNPEVWDEDDSPIETEALRDLDAKIADILADQDV